MNNICNFPQVSPEETNYLHSSIAQFCGGINCDLSFDQFKCECSEPFSINNLSGECELYSVCTKEQNYGNCSKDEFCKIIASDNPLENGHKCVCPIEQGGDQVKKCVDFEIDTEKYCLPGYVINEKPDKEYSQKCVKGTTTFNFTFQVRFDLNSGNNAPILLSNFYELENSVNLRRIPVKLIKNFIDYRESSLDYSINSKMNKQIIRDKLNDILRNKITELNYDTVCHLINVVPFIKFDEMKFNLFRILDSLIEVNISITCANLVSINRFMNMFKLNLKFNSLNENYYHLPDVGFIPTESIKI